MPEETFLTHPQAFGPRGPAVKVIADGPDAAQTRYVLSRKDVKRTYVFTPRGIGDGTPAIEASLEGVPVVLSLEGRWPADVLDRLVDHFLFHPELETPIEPFVTIARTLAEGRGESLWAHGGEILGRDFFITSDGKVSLSERWADAGLFFGTTQDESEALEASDLWRSLASTRERVFHTLDGCSVCPDWHLCGGFFRALEDMDEACTSWRSAVERIRTAWREHRSTETVRA